MLFLQTKFVKCKKIHYKNYFVIFTNFFFKLIKFRLFLLKKIGYKIVCKNFFFSALVQIFIKIGPVNQKLPEGG